MNTKTLLATSLVVNALLLGAAAYLLQQDSGDLSTSAPIIVCTAHIEPDAVETPVAGTVSAVNPAQPFDWRRSNPMTSNVRSPICAAWVARRKPSATSSQSM